MSGMITGLAQYNTDASPHRNWRDALNDWDLLGTSARSAIQNRELVDGKIIANPIDMLFGNSTEELTNRYYKDRAKEIELGVGGELLAEGRDIKVTDSDKVIRKKANDLIQTKLAIEELRQTGGYEGSLTALKGLPASEIIAKIPAAKRRGIELDDQSNPATKRAVAREKAAIEYRNTQDGLLETIRQQTRTDQLGREKQGELNRLQDRQLSAQNNQMMMQLEYARMSQADRQRTADRRDQAIMALLSGLGNLGAAFTV